MRRLFFYFPSLNSISIPQSGEVKPSINGQAVIVRLTMQGERPFGNKSKSCVINAYINLSLACMAKRWFSFCLIYEQDVKDAVNKNEIQYEVQLLWIFIFVLHIHNLDQCFIRNCSE